jgi:hypothetical protein
MKALRSASKYNTIPEKQHYLLNNKVAKNTSMKLPTYKINPTNEYWLRVQPTLFIIYIYIYIIYILHTVYVCVCVYALLGRCGHILRAVHTSSSPVLQDPDGFPGLVTKYGSHYLYSWWWACWCTKHVESIKRHILSHLAVLYLTQCLRCTVTWKSNYSIILIVFVFWRCANCRVQYVRTRVHTHTHTHARTN